MENYDWLKRIVEEKPGLLLFGYKNPIKDAIKTLEKVQDVVTESFEDQLLDVKKYLNDRIEILIDIVDATIVEINKYAKQIWWYKYLRNIILSQLMEEPRIYPRGEQYSGKPIYYVNGILNTLEVAKTSADNLADKFERPVYLIHNKTLGPREDIKETILDRMWPAIIITSITNWLGSEKTIGEAWNIINGKTPSLLQHNHATRQVAHVLYNEAGEISIVGHSQGCVIIRNAFHTLALLGRESKVNHKVAFVAAGPPLNEREIFPIAAKCTILRNANDLVAELVGFTNDIDINQFRNKDSEAFEVIANHAFTKHYLNSIEPEMLFSESRNFDFPSISLENPSVISIRDSISSLTDAKELMVQEDISDIRIDDTYSLRATSTVVVKILEELKDPDTMFAKKSIYKVMILVSGLIKQEGDSLQLQKNSRCVTKNLSD